MKADNICDVAGCGKPARVVKVSINTTDDNGNAMGVVMEQDACAIHRIEAYSTLLNAAQIAIEEALKDSTKKV
jgi:hypothetical protein